MARHKLTADDSRKGAAAAAEAKRRKREEERELLREARAEHLDEAIATLSLAAKRAAAAIEELLDADSEAVRLRAAEDVIQILVDVEVLEMASRIDRLEEAHRRMNGRTQ
jgi:hypothetical protein